MSCNTTSDNLPNHDATTDRIKRPLNSFMLYKRDKKTLFLKENPKMNNRLISRLVAEEWHKEPESVKEIYRNLAKEGRALHAKLYPNYKYMGTRKEKSKVSKINTKNNILFSKSSYCVEKGDSSVPNLVLTSPVDASKKLSIPLTPDVLLSAVSLKNPDEFFNFDMFLNNFI